MSSRAPDSSMPAVVRHAVARPWLTGLTLFLLSLGLYTYQLGVAAIAGDDEARDAAVVAEMAVNGHWLLPLFNGTLPPEKPPLFYWAAAATSRVVGGVSEWSVRFPSAVLAAGTVAMVFVSGGRLVGGTAALLAALCLMTAPLFGSHARIGRTDMALTFCATGFMVVVARLLIGEWPRGRRAAAAARQRAAITMWVWLTLAVLAKGGAGLGAAVSGTGAALLVLRIHPRRLWSRPGAALFFALAGGWHLYALIMLQTTFVETTVIGENVDKLFGTSWLWPGVGHFLKPVLSILTATLPWGVLALWPIARGAGRWHEPGRRLVLAFCAGNVLFFTLAAGRHIYYQLPAVPVFAMVLGCVLSDWQSPRSERTWTISSATAVGVVAATATFIGFTLAAWWRSSGWLGMAISDQVFAETWEQVLSGAPLIGIAVVFAGMLVVVSATLAVARRQIWLAVGCTWAALYVTLLIALPFRVQEVAATDSLKPFGTVVREMVAPEDPLYFYGGLIRGVVFYTGRHIPVLLTDDAVRQLPSGGSVITTDRLRAQLGPEAAARLHERFVTVARPFNLGRESVYLLEAR